MPKERVKHGEIRIRQQEPNTGELPGRSDESVWLSTETVWIPGGPIPEGATTVEAPSLDVTWNRDGGWVQLGFYAPRLWWSDFLESYEGSPEQHSFSAWTEVLDRREINHMIRTLRRARDAAYGSDE